MSDLDEEKLAEMMDELRCGAMSTVEPSRIVFNEAKVVEAVNASAKVAAVCVGAKVRDYWFDNKTGFWIADVLGTFEGGGEVAISLRRTTDGEWA